MTLEQLEYIIAVHQEGTISAAAQKLNISHPSISRASSSLETELGINIFLRSRNGSELTEKGSAVLKCVQKILCEDVGFPAVLTYSNDNSLIKQIVSRGETLSTYTEQLA